MWNIFRGTSPVKLCRWNNSVDTFQVIDVRVPSKLATKLFEHKKVPYVELARNYAINKASGDWILVLDPDEEVSGTLATKIRELIKSGSADYYRIPRKNIIFGKCLKHSRWWPDYNIRLFKRGTVSWSEEIHKVPLTVGIGEDLPDKEEFSIIHHHYDSIEQYLLRMLLFSRQQT